MRIGLNGTAYDALSSGARDRFTNLYGTVAATSPDDEFIVYSPREVSLAGDMARAVARDVRTPLSPARPLLRFLRSGGWFARRLAADRVDRFVTDHFPVIESGGTSTILTIHDLRSLALPGDASLFRRSYFRRRFARVAARAGAIVTVSEAMATEIGERLGIARDRVSVVPNGVREDFGDAPAAAVEAIRARRGLPAGYLLHVGVLERRKNLALLLDVLAANPGLPPLVLAGRGGPEDSRLRARAAELGIESRVVFAGYVPEPELPALFTGAAATLVPSVYEGFGLPVLMSFACGVPVVAARTPALVEVAGDAARIVGSHDEDAWVDAISRVLGDSELRSRMAGAGRRRAGDYSWTAAARRFQDVLR